MSLAVDTNLTMISKSSGLVSETSAFFTVLVLAVTFNATVLLVIRRQKQLQENMRTLHQIVAALDLVLGIVWSLWSIFWFSFTDTRSCAIMSMVFPFPARVTLLSLMACLCGISLNLFLLISRPLRYPSIVTPTRFRVALITSFVVIVLVCSIYLPFPYSPVMEILALECQNYHLAVKQNWPSIVTMCLVVIPIFTTFVFTSIIYFKIYKIAYQKSRADGNLDMCPQPKNIKTISFGTSDRTPDFCQNSCSNQLLGYPEGLMQQFRRRCKRGIRLQKQFKGFLTILLMTGSFCAVWMPWIIGFIVHWDRQWVYFIDVLAISNTWIQPILYLMTNEEAKRLLRGSLPLPCNRSRVMADE